ncbi:hypothetical protein GCK72_005109 [Caenorhabditis remanei]|uniref:ubiquitinyl hydrolase 1 n=1 Tax=Caenorhabditis remanei TaxID=31234 RepID=A0A6A5HDD8_CAERE|nr:hypothetical protein GCK72_005109 [Caenorhabditis remanei]KAF1765157.1 hypothetical protein GCK72_005109 [Caenorhabditis remanei]
MDDEPGPSRDSNIDLVIAKVLEGIKETLPHVTDEFIMESIHKHGRTDTISATEHFMNKVFHDCFYSYTEEDQGKTFGPERMPEMASTSSEPMEVVPYDAKHPNVTNQYEEEQIKKAMLNSLNDGSIRLPVPPMSYSPNTNFCENEEEMIRDWNKTTGLLNQGNSCWFNSLTQMLYSIPKFRSILHHSPPITWHQLPIVNVKPKFVIHAELLLQFRALFAQMQFSEEKFIRAGEILRTVDKLYTSNGTNQSTIGTQQDASEMLILIMQWLGDSIDAAMYAHENPEYSNAVDDNLVISDSTDQPANSDVAGTAPPGYQEEAPVVSSTTKSIFEPPESRPNTPTEKEPIRDAQGARIPKSPRQSIPQLAPVEEAMDTSDVSRKSSSSQPPVLENQKDGEEEPLPVDLTVNEDTVSLVNNLKQSYKKIFEATLTTSTIHQDGSSYGQENKTVHCPASFTLQVEYGNLHDALEASTFSVRDDGVNIRNMYETLPAVFFCSLSRFQFDRTGEKVHNKFTFPRELFMDRYLKECLEISGVLRKELLEKRHELSLNRAKLQGVRSYPLGNGKTINLIDAFETVKNVTSNMRLSEPPSIEPSKREEGTNFLENTGKTFPYFTEENFPGLSSYIEKTNEAIMTLKKEESVLVKEMEALQEKISSIHDVDELKKHKYELHAMIIHDGEINRGHYWTYKLNKSIDGKEEWEKLNDRETTAVSYDQIEKEAYGTGSPHDPSAYLLLYVQSGADWLMAGDNETHSESLANLPSDLQSLVHQKSAEFKTRLENFRQRQIVRTDLPHITQMVDSPALPKSLKSFSWYRGLDDMYHDVNANPDESILRDRLDSYQVPVLGDNEILDMKNTTSFLWNKITFLDPSAFVSSEKLLEAHLLETIDGEHGGKEYIEKNLSCSINELKEDAENEIESVYNSFITNYIGTVAHLKKIYLSRFVVFVVAQLPRIHVPVIRYLLVRSMIHDKLGVLGKHAKKEIQGYMENSSDSGNTMYRIAEMLAHIFHTSLLSAAHCRISWESLEVFFVELNQSRERIETLYNAMIGAKNARILNMSLRRIADFLEQPSIYFITQQDIEDCTVLALLASFRMVVSILMNRACHLHDLHITLTHTGRTLLTENIVEEICIGLYTVHKWSKGLEGHDPANSNINMKELFVLLSNKLDFICASDAMEHDKEKLSVASKMQTALTDNLFHPLDTLTVGAECELDSGESEMTQINKSRISIGNTQSKINAQLADIVAVITSPYM